MGKKLTIATSSFGVLEDVTPPFNISYRTAKENLHLGGEILDAAGAQGVDLVCLPESFLTAGMPYSGSTMSEVAETIDGYTFKLLAEKAKKYNMNVVAGLPVKHSGLVYNMAVVISRCGELLGRYSKIHPTEGEMDIDVVPGCDSTVVETDVGRLGL
jgi:predicted amidohydrolase